MNPTLLLPGGLKSGEPYYLLAESEPELADQVRELLEWASPEACCLGAGRTPPPYATRVLFEANALGRVETLRDSSGQSPVRFLPIPYGYPWAFWDTWRCYDDEPGLRKRLTSFEAFRHFFSRSPYLGGETAAGRLTGWNARQHESLYWNEARETLNSHRAELQAVRQQLADFRSRAVFDLAVDSDPRPLWEHYVRTVFLTTDYLDYDVPRPDEHVLNLGIFSGHEIPYLATLVGAEGVVHCVDPVGLDLLSAYAKTLTDSCPRRILEARFGAGSESGYAHFRSYPDGQVCLDSGGEASPHVFPIRTIDEYVESAGAPPIGFVKVDVEGMELDALRGMQSTLGRCRPTVSIAIYHAPEHLWEIPLWLMGALPNYHFHINHGSPVRWETVLTAVPNERSRRAVDTAA